MACKTRSRHYEDTRWEDWNLEQEIKVDTEIRETEEEKPIARGVTFEALKTKNVLTN